MKLLSGLLLLLGAHAALGADIPPNRRVLLADLPLAELRERGEFTNAVHASESGDGAAAKRELLALTTSGETHVRLLAWNALRNLGVQPDAEDARIVRGVVVERHGETPVGVYEDGRIRSLDAEGGALVLRADRELARLVRTMIAAAEPAMKTTRPMPRSDATPVANDRVRLTVLTYGGYYVIDPHVSALTEEHQANAAIAASQEILRHYDSTDH